MKTLSILKASIIMLALFSTTSCSKEELGSNITGCTNCPPTNTKIVVQMYHLTESAWVSKGADIHTCTFKNLTIGAIDVKVFLIISGAEILVNPYINYLQGKLGFYFNNDLVITYQKIYGTELHFIKMLDVKVVIQF